MKTLYIFVFTFLFCNNLFSQQWIDKVYEINPPTEIEYGQAVNFNGTTIPLKLDVYTPICNASPTDAKSPLMIVIHGGSFIAGEKEEQTIVALCENYAQRGYVTASIEYRLGFVNSSGLHQCNFPNYPCFFAADEAEWYRAWFRAVQDAKGALRYLVNRNVEYNIDTQNVFVVGESAGAIVALGLGYLDIPSEKMAMADALNPVANPNSNTSDCPHNVNETFPNTEIIRPDLGTIDGTIELSNEDYIIKGVGNMYGAMFQDLLVAFNPNKPKPALYSFHRPCDLIVPADSEEIYFGITWCLTHGGNCLRITNTPIVHGSRKIKQWNIDNNYNYNIQSEITTLEFPYEFFNIFNNAGTCLDQLPPPIGNGNNCHSYDNFNLREQNMANFFAPLISTSIICEPILGLEETAILKVQVFPNPASNKITIVCKEPLQYKIMDLHGRLIFQGKTEENDTIHVESLQSGCYLLILEGASSKKVIRLLKD